MEFSAIFNPINLLWGFLMSVGTIFAVRRIMLNSLSEQNKVLKSELDINAVKMNRIEEDNEALRKKDRVSEARFLDLECKANRSRLQLHLHRDENDLMQAVIARCLIVILPQANGSKAAIEAQMKELTDFRKTGRQKMLDFDDEQGVMHKFAERRTD